MPFPGKSHSGVESRNSRSRDSRFRPSTYFYLRDRSWIAGGGAKGGTITGWTRRHSRSMTGPHRHLWTINIAGSGAPETAGARVRAERDRGNAMAIGPRGPDDGPENHPPPCWTSLDNRSTSRAGWARETAGSSRVSGALAHVSKHMLGTRQGDAIANQMPGMRDHRPAIGRLADIVGGWHI